jgi:hypothetical protein
MAEKRPPVRIRFRFNLETGEIEEFIVDDQSPEASEDHHDEMARIVAGPLVRNPEIEDAGRIRGKRPVERTPADPQEENRDADREPPETASE